MPRIFKGSESTLRLLISKTGDYQALTEIKIKLYTTDIENAIEIIDGIQVCKNIAIITLAPRAFMGMEDGLINYIIDGATEDDVFHTERQSNYMLKSLSYINEDGVATQTMTIESNGEYRVTPNDGLYVDINVNVSDLNGSYDDGFNVGYGQGKTDGANEQKSKLETINITENGTYTKEDGYNHIEVNVPDLNGSYDEGYNTGYGQGKTDGVNEQKSKLESINITENGTYNKEDGYNHIEVNVNVPPKINLQKEGIKLAYGTFTEVPEWADFDGITGMARMFNECINLQTIPQIDTSNVTNMEYMFYNCSSLQTIPFLNTSNVTNMYYIFFNCSNLQTIPLLNTSNVTNMNYMFSNCSSLQTIPHLNTSKVIDAANMFERCFDLISIPALDFRGLDMDSYSGFFGWYELPKLTDFGGFLNLKSSLTNDKNLKQLPNLTRQSCINVLNGLYDFTGNGETPGSNQGQLKVHQNFLDKVGEEISIGTNKGWQITV